MLPTLVRRLAPSRPAAASMFANATKRATAPAPAPMTRAEYVHGNYKRKKVWPPDFSKLSEKQKFKFEKRYKRRVLLATQRPRWDMLIRLMQLGSIAFAIVYMALFWDQDAERPPFQGFRNAFWNAIGYSPSKPQHEQPSALSTPADQK
ncbi:hypothetical protein F4777DRAFT_579248 [Nemania sp. FL0916]|nr:hypothetical protein F4777DRAFT_579248 [Nemania sp. FL0916]